METPESKVFIDYNNKICTTRMMGETPLSTVGSEIQLNQLKFMTTADTSFGEYRDYSSPITYRALSPSPRRNRGSLLYSGSSVPLETTME